MKRIVSLLCLLACLLGTQARANPANCDGDMSPDQTEFLEYVVGLHPILFGGPIAILHSCERVKKFLSTLSGLGVSKRSGPVSDEQVRGALDSMGLAPSDASSCLRSLDLNACKRYFGLGSPAATPTPPPAAPAKTALTLARAKIKRDEVLLKDRELAANLVPVCKSIMSAQACEARLLAIENLRDDVARMNQDPELMSFIPPITLDSPDLIPQTGWERGVGGGAWFNRAGNQADREICPELTRLINGLVANAPERARERLPQFKSSCAERDPSYAAWLPRWEAQLAEAGRKAGKAGAYVRPEDCERLSRQIDADLRARPKEEPPSLSFFEVECAGGSEKYAGQVAAWKQAIASRKGVEDLNRWDGDVRKAEAEQKKVWEEEDRRVAAAQRKKAEEDAAARRQQASASALPTGPSGGSVGAVGSAVVCPTERAGYLQAFREAGEPEKPWNSPYFMGKAALASIQLGAMSGTDEVGRQIAFHRSVMEDGQKSLAKKGGDKKQDRLTIAKAQYSICLMETFRQYKPGTPVDLAALTGGTDKFWSSAPVPASGSSGNGQTPSGDKDAASCEAALKKSDRDNEGLGAKPVAGAMASLERVMWMTKDRLALLSANCPNSGKYATMRQELQQAYDSAAAGCRQIKSGGGECTPDRH